MGTEGSHESHGIIPYDAVNQAQLLLEYGAQKGLAIDKGIVSALVQAKHMSQPDKWTSEVETSFWQAYDALAKEVQPVSVHSLKALGKVYEGGLSFLKKYLKNPKVSDADKSVNYYRRLTVLFIIILLSIQILFSYGAAVVTELNLLPDKIARIDANRHNLIAENKTPSRKEEAAANPDLAALDAKKESLERKYRASFIVLEKWLSLIRFGIKAPEPDTGALKPSEKFEKDALGKIVMLQDAVFILLVMQSYLLPLLYGFVGACAYILRTLSSEIKNVTYTRESKVLYLARFLLGGLSGLAIGWFVSPDTESTLKTVSPFALAFVAGYGVELLFSVMDRIIIALSGESSQKQSTRNP